MRITSLAIAPAVLAVATATLAQTAATQEPPPGGTPRPFTLPTPETFTLPNGLGVTLVPYGTVPKVTVYLAIDAANVDETAKQVWLADLTGALLKEGTTTRSSDAVADGLAKMGGSLDVSVGADVTALSSSVLSEFAAGAVEIIAEIAQAPLLPASELPRLKADMVRNLTLAKAQPQSMASERFSQVLYGDHPYGRVFPTEAMVNGYTHADVRAFHAATFGAARSHLYVVGRFDAEAVRSAVRARFGPWQKGTAARRTPPTPAGTRALHVIDRPKASQSTLYIGLPVVDPSHADYVALRVTNALLGGSFASRITANIREQKGYTYSPNSSLSVHPKVAHWVQVADVTTAVTGASMKEIFFEVDRLRQEPPPEEELAGIRNYLAGVFVLQNSSRSGIIQQLEFTRQHGLGADYLRTLVQKIQAVTPADVQRVAKTWLDPAKMTMVVVGDKAEIDGQLAPYVTK
ncbi:M16 family metallopeptidase [Luteitalea sp.]